ncbi:MAG: hypothetical protein ACTHKT_04075 [Solirubrobacterales bacterium]
MKFLALLEEIAVLLGQQVTVYSDQLKALPITGGGDVKVSKAEITIPAISVGKSS